jgi:protein Mpv17
MLLAGYRFWPIVCVLNLVMVPLEYRSLVGNGAGLVWGVTMSLW